MINDEHKFFYILSFLVYKVDEQSPFIHEIYGIGALNRASLIYAKREFYRDGAKT